MKKPTAILATIVMCAAVLPATTFAATAKPIDRREHSEQVRIRQGVRSGELTRTEALRLEREQARIRVNERFARSDGKLTAQERTRLQRELDRASRDIYRQKHDRQDRN